MRRTGMTLMELLVVLAVITLMAGLLFPTIGQARAAARQATCLSNLRQLALAHRLYVEDHDDTLPCWFRREPQGHRLWPEFMSPYFPDPRLLEDSARDWRADSAADWLADYAMCAWGSGGKGTIAQPYWRWPGAPRLDAQGEWPMRLAEVRRPAEVAQFADGVTLRWAKDSSESSIQHRHRDRARNAVFLDGHVRRVTDADWQQLGRDESGFFFYRLAAADR